MSSLVQDLKLSDVYDNLYSPAKDYRAAKRYCPQCGHKTLRNGTRRGDRGGFYVFWACTHNMQPRTWRGKRHDRKPCGLILAFDDRDANIEDYGGVLGLMSQIHVPQIEQFLLRKTDSVHAKGMLTIYEGPIFDVVRRRANDSGVGVGLYWKHRTYESDDETLFDPNYDMFDFARSEAAHFVDFRGFKAAYLFDKGDSVELWQQDEKEEEAVFKGGRCNKKMQAEIVEFCRAFEVAIPAILQQCKAEKDRWYREKLEFKSTLDHHVAPARLRMSMQHYCGHRKTATFSFPAVRPKTASEIADFLEITIPFSGLISANKSELSFDEAQQIEQLLGVEYRVSLRKLDWSMRFNIDQALGLAEIIARDPT